MTAAGLYRYTAAAIIAMAALLLMAAVDSGLWREAMAWALAILSQVVILVKLGREEAP